MPDKLCCIINVSFVCRNCKRKFCPDCDKADVTRCESVSHKSVCTDSFCSSCHNELNRECICMCVCGHKSHKPNECPYVGYDGNGSPVYCECSHDEIPSS